MLALLQFQKVLIAIPLCWHYFPGTQSLPSFPGHDSESLLENVMHGKQSTSHTDIANPVIDPSNGPNQTKLNLGSEIEDKSYGLAPNEAQDTKQAMGFKDIDDSDTGHILTEEETAKDDAWHTFAYIRHIRESL